MMAKRFTCPGCGHEFRVETARNEAPCPHCGQWVHGARFEAAGSEAMDVQERIVKYHEKMLTIRMISCYAISTVFALIGAILILFAPAHREIAANIVAAALFVSAVGIAGFTHFKAKGAGFDISGDQRSKPN
jgi:hypothetical protein